MRRPARSRARRWGLALAAACALAVAGVLVPAGPARAQAPEPPLNISADNVSGSHGPEGDVVNLNGNLRVIRGRSVLTADNGRYFREQGMLYLDGRVKMVDSTTTVTCDNASYSEFDDILELMGNVVVVDREATLRAPRGRYERARGVAVLTGGVEAHDRFQRLRADQVVYVRDSLIVRARGNCRGWDDENKTELESQAIDYDRNTREAVATGDPLLRLLDERGNASILRARLLRFNTETRVAEAIDSVVVERDTLRARADYGLFDDRAQRGLLIGRPRVWDDQTTLSGDTLELLTEERQLREARVRGDARVEYRGSRPATIGEASQLSGREARIWFSKDEIDSLVAIGGARNEYESPPRSGKTAERNRAEGDTITVYFKDRKIDRAMVVGGARGEYRLAVPQADTVAAKREFVTYKAERITFIVPKDRIVLDGTAEMNYREMQLTAGRVVYDVGKQTMIAERNPQLIEQTDKVEGDLMSYDLNTRVGTIYRAETAYEQGVYHGERIRRLGERELEVYEGAYSTCDLESPHYHFSSKWMKIYVNDKLVAKPVLFKLRDVPAFWLPFWIFPIKPGRHSGFLFPQINFGFNAQAGQFIRNAGYYWAPNDYMDLTVSGDYYNAEPSWVMRADGYYKLLYKLNGEVHGSFARNERLQQDNWDFNANHYQEFSPSTRLNARAQFISSRDYNSSNIYGRPLYQRLDRFLRSSAALSHNAPWASFNVVVDRNQDLDAADDLEDPDGTGPLQGGRLGQVGPSELTLQLPNLSVTFPSRTLGSAGFLRDTPWEKRLSTVYVQMSANGIRYQERRPIVTGYQYFTNDASQPDSIVTIGTTTTTRSAAGGNLTVSDQRRLLGWLNIGPSFNARAALFDQDRLGNSWVPAAVWDANVRANFNLYGTFRTRLGPVTGIRHILTPTASYTFSPEFPGLAYTDSNGVTQPRFDFIGGVGLSASRQSFMTYGLEQRLQIKYTRGGKVHRLDNLLALSTRGSYDFLWRERGLKRGASPLQWGMVINPTTLVNANFSAVTDFQHPRPLRNFNYNLGFNITRDVAKRLWAAPELQAQLSQREREEGGAGFEQDWAVGLSYSYIGGYPAANVPWANTQGFNAYTNLQLTPNWRFEYVMSADPKQRLILAQRFTVSRQIHCWEASFTRSFAVGGESEYYFRLGIKQQRELYYERGTRGGTIGGIQ